MQPSTASPVDRSLDASIRDGAAYAVMVGLGEMYVGACAVFLGAADAWVGLIGTVPLFIGACAQMLAPAAIDRTRSRKPWVVGGAILQAAAWIPMIGAVFLSKTAGAALLFGGFALYYASVHFTIPAWMSLMGDLVPARQRGRYFSRRSSAAIAMQLVAAATGGITLSVYERSRHEAAGFAVIFSGALIARAVSTWHLSRMEEPAYVPKADDSFTLRQFLKQLPSSNFAKFVLFVACLNGSAHFAGAVFSVYFLRVLNYSYWDYTIATALIVLVQVFALPYWGRIADRYGNKRVLAATSVGIAFLPALWFGSTHVLWACVVQTVAGFCWSGFNLAASNFLFDAVTPTKRARCTAYLNLITHAGILLGGIAGSFMVGRVTGRYGPIQLPYAFWSMLLISLALRLATLVVFLPRFREVRDVPKIGMVEMLFHASRATPDTSVHYLTPRMREEPPRTKSEER